MGGKPKKLLEQIHPLHIIKEVQKWPALYVKDTSERPNTHFKKKLWCEVAKALFPEWETYTKEEMENKATDLAKRWRNLRDTFRRQAEVERKNREGADIKKKTYVYYSHMTFLLPHLSLGDSDDDAPTQPPQPPRKRSRAARPAPTLSLCLDDVDEDKHFLMSLVPSFKKMSEDEKLTVKVEILKVIRGVRSSTNQVIVIYRASLMMH